MISYVYHLADGWYADLIFAGQVYDTAGPFFDEEDAEMAAIRAERMS